MSRSERVRPLALTRAKSSLERSVDTAPRRVRRTSGGELLAATCAPRGEHIAAGLGLHALAEAVLLGTMALLGLECLLRHWERGSFRRAVERPGRPACPCGCDRCESWCGRPLVVVPDTSAHPTRRIIRDSPVTMEEDALSTAEQPIEPPFLESGSAARCCVQPPLFVAFAGQPNAGTATLGASDGHTGAWMWIPQWSMSGRCCTAPKPGANVCRPGAFQSGWGA